MHITDPSDKRIAMDPADKRITDPTDERIADPSDESITDPSDQRGTDFMDEPIMDPSDDPTDEPVMDPSDTWHRTSWEAPELCQSQKRRKRYRPSFVTINLYQVWVETQGFHTKRFRSDNGSGE
jgi:hypothetical protein